MSPMTDELIKAFETTGIKATHVSIEESKKIRDRVWQKYVKKDLKPQWLWEALNESTHSSHPEAWRWIAEYVGNHECLFFLNEYQIPNVFCFNNGDDIVSILGECSPFEFYLTDSDFSYLLCVSHHNILYAAGKAKVWLEEKISKC